MWRVARMMEEGCPYLTRLMSDYFRQSVYTGVGGVLRGLRFFCAVNKGPRSAVWSRSLPDCRIGDNGYRVVVPCAGR